MEKIFHLAAKDEWQTSLAKGHYFPQNPEGCPFIHCSFESQVLLTANRIFPGRKDLLLLEINSPGIAEFLIVESSDRGQEKFPHIYRPLNRTDIIRELPFASDSNGRFVFPREIAG